MKIRKASKKDLTEIAKLMLIEFRKSPFNEKASLKDVLKSLNFYLKIGNIFIAEKEEIIGVVVFKIEQYWIGSILIIEDLAVKENFKNRGIGKLLISYIEDFAKKNKIKLILFKTHKKSSAIEFYKKLGYKINNKIINFEKKI